MEIQISTDTFPKTYLACIQSIGVKDLGKSFDKLLTWAKKRNITPNDEVKMLTVYQDSFRDTPPNKVRMLAAMTTKFPKDNTEEEVFPYFISEGTYIKGSGEIEVSHLQEAWQKMFLWMKENGHQKLENENPFEVYHSDFRTHPEGKAVIDFYIPIR